VTRRKIAALIAFDLVAILLVACLAALAVWQIHRRAYKLDLIARVRIILARGRNIAPVRYFRSHVSSGRQHTTQSDYPGGFVNVLLRHTCRFPTASIYPILFESFFGD